MQYIENQYITSPGSRGDGLTLCDGDHHVIRNCIIDLSAHSLDSIDEALGITWGCSAEIYNCVFRGAGKLVLCGAGDKERLALEKGKQVVFNDCLFENFSRRGPEVQDGMHVELNRCVIRNWGVPDRFLTRSFGAWAHGPGSFIKANECVFWQDSAFGKNFLKDLIGHFGQAYNDGGIRGLLSTDAWRPGNWRGLVSSDGGSVAGSRCYANHWWIKIEQCASRMREQEALTLIGRLEEMKKNLILKNTARGN